MRLLPPGVTNKTVLFQNVADLEGRVPGGQDILGLLADRSGLAGRASVHSAGLSVLAELPKAKTPGYPSFMNSAAWKEKRQGTQLGGWVELEHAVAPLSKDNHSYLGGYENDIDFHGYVEPAPEFYRALRSLSEKTRKLLAEDLNLVAIERRERRNRLRKYFSENFNDLKKSLSLKVDHPDEFFSLYSFDVQPTVQHFKRLEEVLYTLEELSAKELTEKPFNVREIRFLASYGEELKYLSLNENNIDEPPEPSGVVTSIFTEEASRLERYAATGRPLKIHVVVPYGGKLYLSTGAIYSYYEFDRPILQPVDDKAWKNEVRLAVSDQKVKPRGFESKSKP